MWRWPVAGMSGDGSTVGRWGLSYHLIMAGRFADIATLSPREHAVKWLIALENMTDAVPDRRSCSSIVGIPVPRFSQTI
jgi:hypothetical protein